MFPGSAHVHRRTADCEFPYSESATGHTPSPALPRESTQTEKPPSTRSSTPPASAHALASMPPAAQAGSPADSSPSRSYVPDAASACGTVVPEQTVLSHPATESKPSNPPLAMHRPIAYARCCPLFVLLLSSRRDLLLSLPFFFLLASRNQQRLSLGRSNRTRSRKAPLPV